MDGIIGGMQVGGLPGVSTFAAGRPTYHLVQMSYGRGITSLQWGHNGSILIQNYQRMNYAPGKGQFIIRLPDRPRYNGAKVVYPFTHAGWVVMEEAGRFSLQPPGTTPMGGGASMPLDDTAVAGLVADSTAILKGLGAGPSIAPRDTIVPKPPTATVTPQAFTTTEVRAAQAAAWGKATAAEQRAATLQKWGPPVAVLAAVVLIGGWYFGRRKR